MSAIGFVGLGVMGEPICRNLVKKSGQIVTVFDLAAEPCQRLAADGAQVASSFAALMSASDVVFICLPSATHVRKAFDSAGGVAQAVREGQVVVDLGTSSVEMTREFAREAEGRGAAWVDAPIARTREAAQNGTLSVMVGASQDLFAQVEPLIRCFASEVTLCGGTGAGQVVKILNNMVLFEIVNALSEAVAIARHVGVDARLLLETLSKGSADSFALRNHGMKAIVPGEFPLRAFSCEYALKDLSYALDLAKGAGLSVRGAELAETLLREAIDAGHGDAYFPVISKVVEASAAKPRG